MKYENDCYSCPICQEDLDYDPLGSPCEKCDWWMEEERKEQEKYERLMWERQEYERELWEAEQDRER